MIPPAIADYLQKNKVPHTRRYHGRAITSQELAADMHVSGYRVAKSVLLEIDGKPWIAVLPAAEIVDLDRIADTFNLAQVRLLPEEEMAKLFPDSEVGAEPPFGRLYGLPVLVDARLAREENIVLRGGSHEESIEMKYLDFDRLEAPKVIEFGRAFPSAQTRRPVEVHV
jgi:Ala-tRNA(Pro) deacylase